MAYYDDPMLQSFEEEYQRNEAQKKLELAKKQQNDAKQKIQLENALMLTKKINVSKEITTVHHEISGSLESAIEYLQQMLKEANEKGVKYELDYRKEYGYHNDHYDVIGLVEVREETDTEFQQRVQKHLDQKASATEQRLLQFQKLSKEFGNPQ